MPRFFTIRPILALSFLLCLAAFSLKALPAQVIILRHAEPVGYEKYWKPQKFEESTLSIKGKERAAALVPYLMETPELTEFGTPTAIFAAIAKKPLTSDIAINTMEPIAEALKLTINQTFESNDFKRMAEEILSNRDYSDKTVLICWDGAYIPQMARAFHVLQTPVTWQSNVFDRVWIITFHPSKRADFKNLPQRLMYGDSST